MRRFAALALLAVAPLAACKEEKPAAPAAPAPAAAPQGRAAEAIRASEERLRARLRGEGALTQRAVAVHRQALAETLAVCGQVNPSGRSEDPFIPYVAVIGFEGERAARTELFLAASTLEATRVYFEMVDRCFDGGGPTSTRATARPLPPAPAGLPTAREEPARPAPPLATPAPPAPVSAAGPPQGSVTTSQRTPVNLRASPSGGGEVLRVVPRGSQLTVFGQAPGGWFQVGEAEPWGWVHGSMLEPSTTGR